MDVFWLIGRRARGVEGILLPRANRVRIWSPFLGVCWQKLITGPSTIWCLVVVCVFALPVLMFLWVWLNFWNHLVTYLLKSTVCWASFEIFVHACWVAASKRKRKRHPIFQNHQVWEGFGYVRAIPEDFEVVKNGSGLCTHLVRPFGGF